MINILRKILKDRRGNAVLEFALIFPIFIALIMGIINTAVLLNNNIVAASAARDGGRVVAVTGNRTSGTEKAVKIMKDGGLAVTTGTVNIEQPRVGIGKVTANVNYDVPVFAPGFAALLGGSPWANKVTLNKSSSYYVEYRHRTEYTHPGARCVSCSCRGGCD